MSDDLVRYRQEEVHLGGGDVKYRYVESKDGWIASYASAKAALDAQAAKITRLRTRVAELERLLGLADSWITAALECKEWRWDADQHEAATHTRDELRAALEGKKDE